MKVNCKLIIFCLRNCDASWSLLKSFFYPWFAVSIYFHKYSFPTQFLFQRLATAAAAAYTGKNGECLPKVPYMSCKFRRSDKYAIIWYSCTDDWVKLSRRPPLDPQNIRIRGNKKRWTHRIPIKTVKYDKKYIWAQCLNIVEIPLWGPGGTLPWLVDKFA